MAAMHEEENVDPKECGKSCRTQLQWMDRHTCVTVEAKLSSLSNNNS